jgi:endoglucanase
MAMWRPAFKIDASHPGSDLAAETAAALAASSIFYRNIGETAMADTALQHAKELYDLADFNRGIYTDHIPAQDFYAYVHRYYDKVIYIK